MTKERMLQILSEERYNFEEDDVAILASFNRVWDEAVDACAQSLIDAGDYGHSTGMADIVLKLKTE